MNNYKTRISRGIVGFDVDIRLTYEYLMKTCPPPEGYYNWQRFSWLPDEIAQWGAYYTEWKPLYSLWLNKKGTRTTMIKDSLLLIIKYCSAFNQTHRLYDRIAANPNAVTSDYSTFHLLRGTPLAKTSHTPTADPGTKHVEITIRKIGHLFHQLLITSPDKKGRGKEDGVKEILVFKAYTELNEMAPTFENFQFVGDVSDGLIKVVHSDSYIGKKVWYIAVIKNSRGKLGVHSETVGVIVI